MAPSVREAKRGKSCFGAGCGSLIALVGALLVFVFVRLGQSGSYQPVVPPPLPLPVPNGFDDFVEAGRMLQQSGLIQPIKDAEESIRKWTSTMNDGEPFAMFPVIMMDSLLTDYKSKLYSSSQPILAKLREGLAKECRAPPMRSITSLMPFSSLRDLGSLLAYASDGAISQRDCTLAAILCLDAFEFASDLANGGWIGHGLLRIEVEARVRNRVLQCITELSARLLDQFSTRLQSILQSSPSLTELVTESRHAFIQQILEVDHAIVSGNHFEMVRIMGQPYPSDGWGFSTPWGDPMELQGRTWWRWHRDDAFREGDDRWEKELAEAAKPANRRSPRAESEDWLVYMICPPINQFLEKYDAMTARDRLLLCAFKIRFYQLQHGRLPATLNELGLSTKLTEDPFTGEQLKYTPTGKDYLLYSVGMDFKDDGGLPADERDQPKRGDLGLLPYSKEPDSYRPARYFQQVPHMKAR